jgi:hypothetical protein
VKLQAWQFVFRDTNVSFFDEQGQDGLVWVLVYVDDFQVARSEPAMDVAKELHIEFDVKRCSDDDPFFGLHIEHDRATRMLNMSQSYIQDVLKLSNLADAHPVSTLEEPGVKLHCAVKGNAPSPNAEEVGSLMYLAGCMQPGIMQAVREQLYVRCLLLDKAVGGLLRYLRGTPLVGGIIGAKAMQKGGPMSCR